jgi:hypothetical protein
MRLITQPVCPECGERPIGTNETIRAVAKLRYNGCDDFTYTGETECDDYGEMTVKDDMGKLSFVCEMGHTWFSSVMD